MCVRVSALCIMWYKTTNIISNQHKYSQHCGLSHLAQAERDQLLTQGFANWNRRDFQQDSSVYEIDAFLFGF